MTDLSNKQMFTPSNVVFIVGLAIHLVASYFILDARIEKHGLMRDKDREVTDLKLATLSILIMDLKEQDKIHTLGIETLARIQGNMIKADEPRLKNYK